MQYDCGAEKWERREAEGEQEKRKRKRKAGKGKETKGRGGERERRGGEVFFQLLVHLLLSYTPTIARFVPG